jgi:hypothetical protein
MSSEDVVQNMVSLRDIVVDRAAAVYIIPAACLNMFKAVPGPTNTFTLVTPSKFDVIDDLRALLKQIEAEMEAEITPGIPVWEPYWNEMNRMFQFAIWITTDNPERHGFLGIVIRDRDEPGVGGGPTDEEMQHIKELFVLAGIDPSKYRAFQ